MLLTRLWGWHFLASQLYVFSFYYITYFFNKKSKLQKYIISKKKKTALIIFSLRVTYYSQCGIHSSRKFPHEVFFFSPLNCGSVVNNIWILPALPSASYQICPPLQFQSLCWNDILCKCCQNFLFLSLRIDFVPMHLCLRADFRLCGCAQEATGCQLVQSLAEYRSPHGARLLLVVPFPQIQSIWWRIVLQGHVFIALPHIWLGGLSKVSYFYFALVERINKFIPSWGVCFPASNEWFLWFNIWILIQ